MDIKNTKDTSTKAHAAAKTRDDEWRKCSGAADDFVPASQFLGSKQGYGFRKGPLGLGYYVLNQSENPAALYDNEDAVSTDAGVWR